MALIRICRLETLCHSISQRVEFCFHTMLINILWSMGFAQVCLVPKISLATAADCHNYCSVTTFAANPLVYKFVVRSFWRKIFRRAIKYFNANKQQEKGRKKSNNNIKTAIKENFSVSWVHIDNNFVRLRYQVKSFKKLRWGLLEMLIKVLAFITDCNSPYGAALTLFHRRNSFLPVHQWYPDVN